jgi:hypothetical protein
MTASTLRDAERLSRRSRKYPYCKGATERQVRLIRHNVVVHEGTPKIRLGRVEGPVTGDLGEQHHVGPRLRALDPDRMRGIDDRLAGCGPARGGLVRFRVACALQRDGVAPGDGFPRRIRNAG